MLAKCLSTSFVSIYNHQPSFKRTPNFLEAALQSSGD